MSRASGLPTTATDTSPSHFEREFSDRLAKLDLAPPFALAVSGGGDSMALMRLAVQWAQHNGFSPKLISVLTIDHGLRDGSAAEAQQVGVWARALGLSHHVLCWQGEKPDAGLQEKAREARYHLLCEWCRDHDVRDVLVAHTRDDQSETVAMRLIKGSGTMGLGGMQDVVESANGIRICRPLLGFSGGDLRNWLGAQDISWIEDPSNESPDFERVRVRRALAGVGAGAAPLSQLHADAQASREALELAIDDLLRDGAEVYPEGWARFDLTVVRSAPEIIGLGALSRAFQVFGGQSYPPSRKSLDAVYRGLIGPHYEGGTLAGCILVPDGQNSLILGRETRNISSLSLTAGQRALWDHRFEVRIPREATLMSLAEAGIERFSKAERESIKSAVPVPLRGSLMVIAYRDGAMDVPHAGIISERGLEVNFGGLPPFGGMRPTDRAKRA